MSELKTINGHGIFRCEIAIHHPVTDDNVLQLHQGNPAEEVEWVTGCFDLTENPPVSWMPWEVDDTCTVVTFADGSEAAMRTCAQIFDAMYCDWLAEPQHPQWQLN